jgi:hypothetical protein
MTKKTLGNPSSSSFIHRYLTKKKRSEEDEKVDGKSDRNNGILI